MKLLTTTRTGYVVELNPIEYSQLLDDHHRGQFDSLAGKILAYRKLNRMTQAEFAKLAGVSRNYLSQIENGVASNLSLKMAMRISAALAGEGSSG